MFKTLSDDEAELLDAFVNLVFQCARYERPSSDWIEAGEKFINDLKDLNPGPAAWRTLPEDITRYLENKNNLIIDADVKEQK